MLEGARVAIFGVNDGRRSGDNEGCAAAPDAIREWFYQLVPHSTWKPTVDLGNIRAGAEEADTYAAVHSVVAELVQMGIVPIVLGGGHDLTIPLYRALESVGRPINVVTVDPRLDFGGDPEVAARERALLESLRDTGPPWWTEWKFPLVPDTTEPIPKQRQGHHSSAVASSRDPAGASAKRRRVSGSARST